MDERQILREAMSVFGTNQTQLAHKLGYKKQSGVGNILQRNMSINVLVRILNAMDCDLVVRSRKAVKAPGGVEYVPEWTVTAPTQGSGSDDIENHESQKNPKKAKKAVLEEDI